MTVFDALSGVEWEVLAKPQAIPTRSNDIADLPEAASMSMCRVAPDGS